MRVALPGLATVPALLVLEAAGGIDRGRIASSSMSRALGGGALGGALGSGSSRSEDDVGRSSSRSSNDDGGVDVRAGGVARGGVLFGGGPGRHDELASPSPSVAASPPPRPGRLPAGV